MLLKASAFRHSTLAIITLALVVGASLQTAAATDIAAVGPIENVDCKASSVQVLGIRFVARDAKTATVLCALGVSASPRYVSVQGTKDAATNVQLDKLQLVGKVSYVAGATPVYIRGEVSDVSFDLGLISVSGALVDASFAAPAAGVKVEVVGTQPVEGGVVIPSTLNVLSNSSIGSGIATNSSIGSGLTTNSSIGSGLTTNSSIGSGIATNSSIGSGLTTNSSIGSGIATNSSIGSGLTTNSSIGSGLTSNSSIGSGIAINSSIGSGAARASSPGSGAALNSSIGSGRQIKSVIGSG